VIHARLAGTAAGLTLATIAAAPAPATDGVSLTANAACADARQAIRTNPTLETLKAFGDCEIDRRLTTIATLRTRIAGAKAATGDHAAALTAILDGSQGGLTTLKAKLDAETTVRAARDDVHAIFADYRIYALVTRQVHLVLGDDRVAAAAARLTDASGKLQAAIEKADAAGKDTADAAQHLAAMQAAVADALAAVAGDADAVLPLTPAQVDAGTAGPVLDAAHASLVTARGDIQTALTEAKAARAALQALL
jgi:hypothetical protein